MIRLLRAFFSAWWYYMTVSAIAYKARWSLYTYALDGSGKDIYLSQLDKAVRYTSFEQLYSTLDKKNALNQHNFIVMLGWDDKQYTQFFAAYQRIEEHESLFSQDITAFVLNDADPLSKIDMLLECIDGMLSRNTVWDAQTDIETFINTYKTQQESVRTDIELDGNDEASSQDGISYTTPTRERVKESQGNGIKGESLQQDVVQYQCEEESSSNKGSSTTYSTPVQLRSRDDENSSTLSDYSEGSDNGSGWVFGGIFSALGRMLTPNQDSDQDSDQDPNPDPDPDQGNGYTRYTS